MTKLNANNVRMDKLRAVKNVAHRKDITVHCVVWGSKVIRTNAGKEKQQFSALVFRQFKFMGTVAHLGPVTRVIWGRLHKWPTVLLLLLTSFPNTGRRNFGRLPGAASWEGTVSFLVHGPGAAVVQRRQPTEEGQACPLARMAGTFHHGPNAPGVHTILVHGYRQNAGYF